jgi:hypothetical protein
MISNRGQSSANVLLPSGALAAPRAFGRLSSAAAFLGAEGTLISVAAAYVLSWALLAPYWIQNDTWLTLLAGREIAAHGVPRTDTLTAVTAGQPWIDQQWLAQLLLWQVHRVGGMGLLLLTEIALLLAPLVLGIALARRRGASAVAIVPFAIVPALVFSSSLRTELFSHLLFVVLLALLASEARRRSARVLLAFPLLAIWANLHGAVLVGAALVAVLGLSEALELRRSRPDQLATWGRPLALVAGPWLCLLATPYGLSIASYYRSTVGNPVFREAIVEWAAPTFLSPGGLTLFPLAAAALVLVSRQPRRLNTFEMGALGFTLLGALLANRSIAWFAYTCLVVLPPLVARPNGLRSGRSTRNAALAGLALVVVATAALATAVSSGAGIARNWPRGAVAAVEGVLRRDPQARVFASYEYGDWLLYELPAARGRVAFDDRFEVLTQRQARTVFDYLWQRGPRWEQPSSGYRIVVLHPKSEQGLVETYERRGTRVLFRSKQVVVFDRGPAADRPRVERASWTS